MAKFELSAGLYELSKTRKRLKKILAKKKNKHVIELPTVQLKKKKKQKKKWTVSPHPLSTGLS